MPVVHYVQGYPGRPGPYPYYRQGYYPAPPPPQMKREIKRRTRTGCLTCRKRRIKCDERKPYCLNCEKSKKVCLGFDHVDSKGAPGALVPSTPVNAGDMPGVECGC